MAHAPRSLEQALGVVAAQASLRWYNPVWWSKAGKHLATVMDRAHARRRLRPSHVVAALAAFAAVQHRCARLITFASAVLMAWIDQEGEEQAAARTTPSSSSSGGDGGSEEEGVTPGVALRVLACLLRVGHVPAGALVDALAARAAAEQGRWGGARWVAAEEDARWQHLSVASVAAACAGLQTGPGGGAVAALLDAAGRELRAMDEEKEEEEVASGAQRREGWERRAAALGGVCYARLVRCVAAGEGDGAEEQQEEEEEELARAFAALVAALDAWPWAEAGRRAAAAEAPRLGPACGAVLLAHAVAMGAVRARGREALPGWMRALAAPAPSPVRVLSLGGLSWQQRLRCYLLTGALAEAFHARRGR